MEISIKVAVRVCPPNLNRKHLKQQQVTQEDKPPGNGSNKQQSFPEQNPFETDNDAHNVDVTDQDSLGAKPKHTNNDNDHYHHSLKCCVQTMWSPITPPPGVPPGIVQVGPHTFPVGHALPINCSQYHVYNEAVLPLMTLFMEGFDASVVTYGQRGCGKTYTMYGKGFGEGVSEQEHGIVAHCVREIFNHIGNHPERTYTVNITWVEVCRDIIKDLFGVGSVQCMSMADVFHWLQVGYNLLYNSNLRMGHSLFSLTLEQRWISREGLIQHRLSTASFTDLGPTERVLMLNAMHQPIGVPKDLGLQALEHVVNILADQNQLARMNGNVPYNQTALSAMLKDSFGGRAQTLVMVCVSPFERDVEETLWNMQFAFKAQLVRNIVVINSYSDDNTPVPLDAIMPEVKNAEQRNVKDDDNFGLQFAAKQWSNLVTNAEELLTRLMCSDALPANEKHQINVWLLRKQEYEECLRSSEAKSTKQNLTIIQETEELEGAVGGDKDGEQDEEEQGYSLSSEADTALQANSSQDTDDESERSDIDEHLECLMQNLRTKTDDMIQRKYQGFMETHPHGVMESLEERPSSKKKQKMEEESEEERRLSGASVRRADGRRRSVIPGSTLSSTDLAKLNRVALNDNSKGERTKESPENEDILSVSLDLKPLRKPSSSRLEGIKKKLRKLNTDIEARLEQIKKIEETMSLKQNIITELMKNNESTVTAKQKCHKKRAKLEAEYEKTKISFNKGLTQNGERNTKELERLKANIIRLEQRLNDVTSIKDIAGESTHKIKKLQQSLIESKKIIEGLQKKVKKERKLKDILKNELVTISGNDNENEHSKALVKVHGSGKIGEEKRKNLKEVQTRIAHLDQVLKEKSENLQQYGDQRQREGLRHEIRNLRKTRDHLLDQRCSLDRKLKREKALSHKEERKLLECEEAIEAIDAAIEFKNELICGNKSIDTSEKLQREKGAQMLMARLNNLTSEEMRTLLYKYFIKVIDLRDSSQTLEMQLMQLERERDAWEWKEQVLSNGIRQARLEGERNAVHLQRQHEMKLTLMLRHLAEDSCNSSGGSFSEQSALALSHFYKATNPRQHSPVVSVPAEGSYSSYSDTEYEWPHYQKQQQKIKTASSESSNMDLSPLAELTSMEKFRHPEKLKDKDKDKDSKNKLFAKFQILTRYASNSNSNSEDFIMPSSLGKRKSKDSPTSKDDDREKELALQHLTEKNFKKLAIDSTKTKVTRQGNKLVIQDKTRRQDVGN